MTRWRVACAVVLTLLVGVPLAMPLLDLASHCGAWRTWAEGERLRTLALNTALLVAGTLALALPIGIAGAVLLYRTDLPLRGLFRFVTIYSLFVPLPLLTSAWQATLGASGWLPIALWPGQAGRPWSYGLAPAVWVHAQAALPWVVLIVGQALCWVEGELEEDALLATNPWRVLWRVTLPRCRAAIGAAALWVGLQTAGEITVTDKMQFRTFAEEVFTQFEAGDFDALARAVAVSLPAVGLTWLLLLLLVPRLQRSLPPLQTLLVSPRVFRLGRARWPSLAAVLAVALLLLGVPVASLVWKAGLHGRPLSWSGTETADRVFLALQLHGRVVAGSLLLATLAGILTAGFALLLCWLSLGTRWFPVLVLSILAVAWSIPGPVAGFGLKDTILNLALFFRDGIVDRLLYKGPSPAPLLWADILRFLPYATAVLWPVVRLLPQELRDAARVDGALPRQELGRIVLPLTLLACLGAALVVTALALGEISAGKLVQTPGWETFASTVSERMHYGVSNDVAALCLLLLCMVLPVGVDLAARAAVYRLSRYRPPLPGADRSLRPAPR